MTEELPQAACPMCGGTHLECSQAIFDGMDMMAFFEAERRLSEEGMDALRRVMQAAETLPGGLKEAWELPENFESLPAHELRAIETYLARWTLLDTARAELYDGQHRSAITWIDTGIVTIDGQRVQFPYTIKGPQYADYELSLRCPDGSRLSIATNCAAATDLALDEVTETDEPWGALASRTAHSTPAYKALYERVQDWARQKEPPCPTNRSIPSIALRRTP